MAAPAQFPFEGTDRHAVLPLIAVGGAAVLVTLCTMVSSPEISVAVLVGVIGASAIMMRPEFGVVVLLSSFLVTYPPWMRLGFLSLNNALGIWLLMILGYRIYRQGDWTFLRAREVQLLIAIGVVGLFARYLHEYDDLTRALVGDLETRGQDPARLFLGRLSFLIFFVTFLYSRSHVYVVFVMTLALLVASGLGGVSRVLSGGGFEGYRANWGLWVAAAGNPNRLALFSVIGVIGLWYLAQWRQQLGINLISGILIAMLALAVFMAASRSGVTGLFLAALLLFFEGGLTARKVVVGLLATLVAVALIVQTVPEQSLERLTALPGTARASDSLGGGSIERRSYGAEVALDLAEENLFIGVGIGNWEIVRYMRDPAHYATPPHSSYLSALVEGGIVSLGLYLLLFAYTLRGLFQTEWALLNGYSPYSYDKGLLWVVRTVRTGFIVYLAFSLVGDLWRVIIFYWFIGLAVILRRVVLGEVTWTRVRA